VNKTYLLLHPRSICNSVVACVNQLVVTSNRNQRKVSSHFPIPSLCLVRSSAFLPVFLCTYLQAHVNRHTSNLLRNLFSAIRLDVSVDSVEGLRERASSEEGLEVFSMSRSRSGWEGRVAVVSVRMGDMLLGPVRRRKAERARERAKEEEGGREGGREEGELDSKGRWLDGWSSFVERNFRRGVVVQR